MSQTVALQFEVPPTLANPTVYESPVPKQAAEQNSAEGRHVCRCHQRLDKEMLAIAGNWLRNETVVREYSQYNI